MKLNFKTKRPSIKHNTDNIETIFMGAKERKEEYLRIQKKLEQETLLKINNYLNESNGTYIIWDESILSEYCLNFLKEKDYIVSEEFNNNCFYYKISFDV